MNFYTIGNDDLSIELCDFGARVSNIVYRSKSMCCRYPNTDNWLNDPFYLGATIGPIANRIENGRLLIQGKQISLPNNEGHHCLHSGALGFDKRTWTLAKQTTDEIQFELVLDGSHKAWFGATVLVSYRIEHSTLLIEHYATSLMPAYFNLTNHLYFNLDGSSDFRQTHLFQLFADNVLSNNKQQIPNGESTRWDRTKQFKLDQLSDWQGSFDNHFAVNELEKTMNELARIKSSKTETSLTISSSKPGFQFYTGQFLHSPFNPFQGFCIEPQYAPNAINNDQYFSPLTTPDKPYLHRTSLRFLSES